MQPQTFLFFGPSGSGKGTQAKLLKEFLEQKDPDRKVLYLETGEKLREFAQGDSYTAKRTKETLESGGLMPEFMAVTVWSKFFIENVSGDEHIILDGISRREHEAIIVDSVMKFYERKEPCVISIEVSPHWATERLMERGRVDDKEEEIKKRMAWYEKNVVSALSHFKNNSYYKFIEVNGEQSIEEVRKEIFGKVGF